MEAEESKDEALSKLSWWEKIGAYDPVVEFNEESRKSIREPSDKCKTDERVPQFDTV